MMFILGASVRILSDLCTDDYYSLKIDSMKTFNKIIIGVVMLTGIISLASCDKIESLADVHFDTNLVADLNVAISGESKKSTATESYYFNESVSVDPRQDPDIDKYFDKLKGYKVNKVTGTIKSVNGGPVTILNGNLTIMSGDISATWEVKDFVVKQGATLTLGNENGQWDDLQKVLDEKKAFTVTVEGATDKGGVVFLLSVDIDVTVTANPLK
jgi:hypothetical protein